MNQHESGGEQESLPQAISDNIGAMSKIPSPSERTLIPLGQLEQPARICQLLSHPQRVRILDFLDLCPCPQRFTEIVNASEGAPQAIVSQQLRTLKEGGLLESWRDGNQVFYRIVSPDVRQYLTFLRESL